MDVEEQEDGSLHIPEERRLKMQKLEHLKDDNLTIEFMIKTINSAPYWIVGAESFTEKQKEKSSDK